MIKKTEVRLGSLVQHDHEGVLKITGTGSIGFAAKDAEGNQWKFNYEDVGGVPLTRDCFFSLPLIIAISPDCFQSAIFELDFFIINGPGPTHPSWALIFKGRPVVEIKYVHQLQNLFTDLTGEDLDVQNLLK